MRVTTNPLPLTKLVPLTISRGTSAGSANLLVTVEHDGVTGLGEMSPYAIGGGVAEDAATAATDLARWAPALADLAPWEMQRVEAVIEASGGGHGARAALDAAMHDWLGKRAGLPVWRILGLDPTRIAPTSVTVGICPPEAAAERVCELMARLRPGALKIKLGCADGIEADQAMFEAVARATPPGVRLRVDANGGWTVEGARCMARWLADRSVEYLEQPLPRGHEDGLPALYADAPLPLFADESCLCAADVPRLADRVHGVNLKLMKAGGIREGLRVIHTARAHGLQVMMGCMSESTLAISASVQISPLADHLDLDSQLNVANDPFVGLSWSDGRVLPSSAPGLGVRPAC